MSKYYCSVSLRENEGETEERKYHAEHKLNTQDLRLSREHVSLVTRAGPSEEMPLAPWPSSPPGFDVLWINAARDLESLDSTYLIRASPAISPRTPPGPFFFHPDGRKRPSYAPSFSFSSGFRPKSVRTPQAILGFPGCCRGLRMKQTPRPGPRVSEISQKLASVWGKTAGKSLLPMLGMLLPLTYVCTDELMN